MALMGHGVMKRIFNACHAPSTLGSFLRSFAFGHVRQLDAVSSGFLVNLAEKVPLPGSPGTSDFVFVDVDLHDTIIEVHGHAKQGSGYGCSGGARAERAAGHRFHAGQRPGHPGPAAAQVSGALRPRR